MKNIERIDKFLKEEYAALKDALLELEAEYSDAEIKKRELNCFLESLEEDDSKEDVFSPFQKSRKNTESIVLEKERIKAQEGILAELSEKIAVQKKRCAKYEKVMKELEPILDGDLWIVRKDKILVITDLIALCEEELADLENDFSDMIKKFALVDSNRVLLDSKKYFKRMTKIRKKLEECREMLK